MSGALVSEEARRAAFANALTFASGFAVLTCNLALDALDALQEAVPAGRGGDGLTREERSVVRRLAGGGGSCGELRLLELNIRQFTGGDGGDAFLLDCGNLVHAAVEGALQRLTFAIANSLGRCHGIPRGRINAYAKLIVAQSVASLGAEECARFQGELRGCAVTMRRGGRTSVPRLLGSVSPGGAARLLRRLNESLIGRSVPDGFDVFAYKPVRDGVTAAARLLKSSGTWDAAVRRSGELNGVDVAEV